MQRQSNILIFQSRTKMVYGRHTLGHLGSQSEFEERIFMLMPSPDSLGPEVVDQALVGKY